MKGQNGSWVESENPEISRKGSNLSKPQSVEVKTDNQAKTKVREELKNFADSLVEKPKKESVLLEQQLAILNKMLGDAIEDRTRETRDINARIAIQAEEAKIMTMKEMEILQQKTKLEMVMEKDAQKRVADLRANITKLNQLVAANEKNIVGLEKKRKTDEMKNDKMLEGLLTKRTQAKLKRERAEAVLNGLEILQKEKTLQKIFIQKQLNKFEPPDKTTN